MRINTNVSALDTLRNLSVSNAAVASSTQKLSSGFRINKASDDAAGLAIANGLRNTGKALSAASKNAEQAGAMLQIADGAAQSIAQILDRMKELTTQYASANTGTDAQTNIGAEFTALTDEITRIVNTTTYSGTTLFGGSFDFVVDATGTSDDTISVAVDSVDASSLDVTDGSTVDDLLTSVNTALGNIGAAESRVQFAQGNLATKIENTAAAESVIRDVDMASEMSNFSKSQILSQAGMTVLAQANNSAQSILQLLRG